ncbi:MAG: methyltransferase [Verrucomicrobiales bacterium]
MAERFGVLDQFEMKAGDLNEIDFGSNYDVVTLGHILHSEGRESSQRLIKKINAAMKPDGTIAIAEFTPNEERTGPPHTLIFAVNMLVNTEQGDAFTFGEIRTWLEAGGFTNIRTLDVPGPSPLILAKKR